LEAVSRDLQHATVVQEGGGHDAYVKYLMTLELTTKTNEDIK